MNNYPETDDFKLYQSGISFMDSIGLFKDVNLNNQFYSGDPWKGVDTKGLPITSLPLIRQIINHEVSIVSGDDLAINYSIDGIEDNDNSPEAEQKRQMAKMLSGFAMNLWEALQEDSKNEQALLDGAISGDGLEYTSWNPSVDKGNGIKGELDTELVDNVNYFPGNPNSADVQSQPYIIISFRKMVEDLKKEAKKNGVSVSEIDKIEADSDTQNQAGDMAKIELAKSGKCTCLLKMWKKDGKVWFNKSTRSAQITKGDIDSELTLYPIAKFNWLRRKNCAYGITEVKGIIPNQVAINKLVSMVILAVMHIAIPKMVYDKTRMAQPTNLIGGAIGVDGTGQSIKNVIDYITPGQLSNDIYKIIDMLIEKTKELLNATPAALGQLNMDNTSALSLLQKASAVPFKPISRRYYQFNEDKARIFMDFFIHKYIVERTLTYKEQGITKTFKFNGEDYKDMIWKVKIDVGASTHWSQVTTMATLDNLLQSKWITFPQYLERLPKGTIPMTEKLLSDQLNQDEERQLMFKLMADYVEGLPPEQQQAIRQMKPDEMEMAVKQMIMQPQPAPQQGASFMPQNNA